MSRLGEIYTYHRKSFRLTTEANQDEVRKKSFKLIQEMNVNPADDQIMVAKVHLV